MEFDQFNSLISKFELTAFENYYKDEDTDTKLKCKHHDIINQNPIDTVKYGCLKCMKCFHTRGKCELCEGVCESFSDYIILFRQVHGDRFELREVDDDYINMFCKQHGWATKSKKDALRESCRSCKTNKEHWVFINNMITKFGFKYDYSMVDYKNNNTKIILKDEVKFLVAPKTILK